MKPFGSLVVEFLDWLEERSDCYLRVELGSRPPIVYEPADTKSPLFLPRLCRYLELSGQADVAIYYAYKLYLVSKDGTVQSMDIPDAMCRLIVNLDTELIYWLVTDERESFSIPMQQARRTILLGALDGL